MAYSPFDQDQHLGSPPWRSSDPALRAWEAAHGHDVRLKCYPEFGCQAIEDEADRLRDAVARVRALHTRARYDYYDTDHCAYCAGLCHSGSGLGCDSPDAPWPCDTIRALDATP